MSNFIAVTILVVTIASQYSSSWCLHPINIVERVQQQIYESTWTCPGGRLKHWIIEALKRVSA